MGQDPPSLFVVPPMAHSTLSTRRWNQVVAKGSANSQIPEPGNLRVYFGSLCPPPVRTDGGEELGPCIPHCASNMGRKLVHLFPFWELRQLLTGRTSVKGCSPLGPEPDDWQLRLLLAILWWGWSWEMELNGPSEHGQELRA